MEVRGDTIPFRLKETMEIHSPGFAYATRGLQRRQLSRFVPDLRDTPPGCC